jgi:hypothetical protein
MNPVPQGAKVQLEAVILVSTTYTKRIIEPSHGQTTK